MYEAPSHKNLKRIEITGECIQKLEGPKLYGEDGKQLNNLLLEAK